MGGKFGKLVQAFELLTAEDFGVLMAGAHAQYTGGLSAEEETETRMYLEQLLVPLLGDEWGCVLCRPSADFVPPVQHSICIECALYSLPMFN